MRINSRFHIERDPRNWVLVETWTATATRGKNQGKPTERERKSYYGSLDTLFKHLIDRSLDADGGMADILWQLEQARDQIMAAVRKYGLEKRVIIKEESE